MDLLEVVVVVEELEQQFTQGLRVGGGRQLQRLLDVDVVDLLTVAELLRELFLQAR